MAALPPRDEHVIDVYSPRAPHSTAPAADHRVVGGNAGAQPEVAVHNPHPLIRIPSQRLHTATTAATVIAGPSHTAVAVPAADLVRIQIDSASGPNGGGGSATSGAVAALEASPAQAYALLRARYRSAIEQALELLSLLLFCWTMGNDLAVAGLLLQRDATGAGLIVLGLVLIPCMVIGLLVVLRNRWISVAARYCLSALNMRNVDLSHLKMRWSRKLAYCAVVVLFAVVGFLVTLYLSVCYLLTSLLSVPVMHVAMLVAVICPAKRIFAQPDLVYLENYKFAVYMLQCGMESLPMAAVLGRLLYASAAAGGPGGGAGVPGFAPGDGKVGLFGLGGGGSDGEGGGDPFGAAGAAQLPVALLVTALVASVLNVTEKMWHLLTESRSSGTSVLAHLQYMMRLRGAFKVPEPVLELALQQMLKERGRLHVTNILYWDDPSRMRQLRLPLIPRYLLPSDGGWLVPGQMMKLLRMAFKRYCDAGITRWDMEHACELELNVVLRDGLTVFKSLKRLSLKGCRVGGPASRQVGVALARHPKLRHLHLSRTHIDTTAAKALARCLGSACCRLKTLAIVECRLSPRGAAYIAQGLKDNTSLKRVNFAGNNIGKQGAAAFAEALQHNRTLLHLNLAFNRLTPAGAVLLADALRANTTLTSLVLSRKELGAVGGRAVCAAMMQRLQATAGAAAVDDAEGAFAGDAGDDEVGAAAGGAAVAAADVWSAAGMPAGGGGNGSSSRSASLAREQHLTLKIHESCPLAARLDQLPVFFVCNEEIDVLLHERWAAAQQAEVQRLQPMPELEQAVAASGLPLHQDDGGGGSDDDEPTERHDTADSNAGGVSYSHNNSARAYQPGPSRFSAESAAAVVFLQPPPSAFSAAAGVALPTDAVLPALIESEWEGFNRGASLQVPLQHAASLTGPAHPPLAVLQPSGPANMTAATAGSAVAIATDNMAAAGLMHRDSTGSRSSRSGSGGSSSTKRCPGLYLLTHGGMADNVAQAVKVVEALEIVDLRGMRVGDHGVRLLAECLADNNCRVHELRLAGNDLHDEAAEAIATAVASNTHLRLLDLSDNTIGDAGAVALAVALEKNSTLEQLLLCDNRFPWLLETLRRLQEPPRKRAQRQQQQQQQQQQPHPAVADVSSTTAQPTTAAAQPGGAAVVASAVAVAPVPPLRVTLSQPAVAAASAAGQALSHSRGHSRSNSLTNTLSEITAAGSVLTAAAATFMGLRHRRQSSAASSNFSDPDNACGVCLDAPNHLAIRNCGHRLCVHCYRELCRPKQKAGSGSCPFCRADILGFQYLELPAAPPAVPAVDVKL